MFNKLYTGYFAKVRSYIEHGYTPVSVAGKTPSFFSGEKWLDFAPRKGMFLAWKSGKISDKEYLQEYCNYLREIPKEDIEELRELTKEADYVMCCYEKRGDFCHRHGLAWFLRTSYGFDVKELEV